MIDATETPRPLGTMPTPSDFKLMAYLVTWEEGAGHFMCSAHSNTLTSVMTQIHNREVDMGTVRIYEKQLFDIEHRVHVVFREE